VFEAVTIEDVIFTVFMLVAVSEPTVISGVPAKPVAVPVKVPVSAFAVIVPLALILPEAVIAALNVLLPVKV
jgi:hypothetical protein